MFCNPGDSKSIFVDVQNPCLQPPKVLLVDFTFIYVTIVQIILDLIIQNLLEYYILRLRILMSIWREH